MDLPAAMNAMLRFGEHVMRNCVCIVILAED